MGYWFEKSKDTLLEMSEEKTDFEIALQEWEHSGLVKDHVTNNADCELCSHPHLRHQFEVKNRVNGKALWVGSTCIEKFEIAVYDDQGNLLDKKAIPTQLKAEVAQQQLEMILNPLRELYNYEKDLQAKIVWSVEDYKISGGFAPAALLFLFQYLKKNGIAYYPQLHKVFLRSFVEKDELFQMELEDRQLIMPCLSAQQKKRLPELEKEYLERQEAKRNKCIPSEPQYLPPSITPTAMTYKPPPRREPVKPGFLVKEIGMCRICGKKTTNWWWFDGATKMCHCRDCPTDAA